MAKVLAINGGASSIKFALFDAANPVQRLLEGKIERIGLPGTLLDITSPPGTAPNKIEATDHAAAVKHCTEGIGIWQWTSNDQAVAPDVVMACCGDVPTLETLAAISILHEHLHELKIRVVNVVGLMKLQPPAEHPHGLSDMDFDELFTKDKPVIFAHHAYPWLIHHAELVSNVLEMENLAQPERKKASDTH